MSKKVPVLKLSKKTPLKIEAKNGEEEFVFWIELPHWNYLDKKKQEKAFFQANKEVQKLHGSIVEQAQNLTELSETIVATVVADLADTSNLEPLKQWYLNNVQALNGLEISEKDSTSDEEIVTKLTRDHEWFIPIFEELWAYDYNIVALNLKLVNFFKGELA